MKPLRECCLYTFVDTAYLHGRNPAEVARQLCDGGSDLIQLRAKTFSPEAVGRIAEAIRPITEQAGVGLVINDLPSVAINFGADCCHLGQEDFFTAGYTHVSQVTGSPALLRVGLSSHAPDQAQRAVAAGADYVAIGPVYATATKPTAQPVTLEYVRWAAASISLPWFAIGGIHMGNVEAVLAAGARRICVVSAILNAPDIAKACLAFKRKIEEAGSASV